MNDRRNRAPSKLPRRLLYAAYLALWFGLVMATFALLFPDRWSGVKDQVELVRQEISSGGQSSTRVGSGTLERLHERMVQSRWPLSVYRYHETFGYEPTPGVSVKLRDGSFTSRTHELGFRIPLTQDLRSLEPGGLLSVGCSFTFGDLVEAEQAFTFVAGELLGLPSYNYGVPSYSYVGALARLEELQQQGILDRLAPSAITLGAGSWLFERSTSPFYPTDGLQYAYSYFAKENGRISIQPPPEQFSIRHQFELNGRYFPNGRREPEFTAERRALLEQVAPTILEARSLAIRWRTSVTRQELYDLIVERLQEVARSRGIPALVLWMPSNYMNGDPPAELRRAIARSEDVHLLLGDEAVGSVRMGRVIGHEHPTKEAHRLYGQAIATKLREMWAGGATLAQ